MLTRREVIRSAAAGAAALALPSLARAAQPAKGFTLPPLPYANDALEPHIDAEDQDPFAPAPDFK